MLFARMTINQNFPPPERPGILHLMDIRTINRDDVDVTSVEAFAAYLAAHPEIGHVIVYDSRFPQRGRSWQDFLKKDVRKLWDETELVRALTEVQRKRMADPNYVPTLSEALRHPKEFVDGMTEK